MIGLVLKYQGNRLNVPGDVELSWTIAYVMDLMSNQLPPLNEIEVLYLRTVVSKKDWSVTTLAQLFGLSTTTTTGNYCISLQQTKSSNQSSTSSEDAIKVLLQNNFDEDSITCLITICKLVDNVLKSSLDDMSKRTLKTSNKILQQKIFSKVGGLEFISSLGFNSNDGGAVYTLEKPNITVLLQARNLILQTLQQPLHCPTDQLPSLQPPPIPPPKKQPLNNGNNFNPYVTQNYNTQKGGSNPVLASNNVSTTERHLQLLQSKQSKLEQQIQLTDRQILAFPPATTATTATTTYQEGTTVKSTSDGSLIAARMKQMEEERKKREEGGFTTKAMRDLEKMKKAKVYSHVQLRICFPDGSYLTAKFLPRETIQMVKDVIQSCFSVPNLEFDLYVAPPRRMLQLKNKLSTEGLVPAAKVHVSWKVNGSPPPNATFLQPHLFQEQYQQQALFPNAKPIVEDRKEQQQKANKRAAGGGNNRQDALLRKMMGKPTSLLRGNNTNNKKSSDGPSKPKWFKP